MQVFYGSVINPESLTFYKASPNCLLAVNKHGNVEWIEHDVEDSMVQEVMLRNGCSGDEDVVVLKFGQFIMPGFIDTHTHAPQLPNIGTGSQYELLDWLEKITFPTEAKFHDVDLAKRTYQDVVRRIIDTGTTTCCYYGSLHLGATKALANVVHSLGQRAFVGKCNMNRNSPSYYVEPSVHDSIHDTQFLIDHIEALPGTPRVYPILTPRFAISCTDALLSKLGDLARSNPSLRIQTHISENKSEIKFTKELFPDCPTYASVYDSFGLLRGNTVLAHAVHLEEEEMALVKQRNAGISHCPTSNFHLNSGIAPVGEFLDKGIKVGLGTDCSGGYSPSMLNSIRNASIASKVRAMQADGALERAGFKDKQLSLQALLYLATLGGAQVCDLESQIGSFAPGKTFDALVVDVRNTAGNPALWGVDSELGNVDLGLDGMLERFFFCGDERNISSVYVQGKLIGGTSR
ncbi:guanine deaminase [Moniliophthora roreri MCA 2997]|uniref:Guanine deaminase n=2 Tax=Moniliophthora roreri TaxID=221103 RepID=V2XBJ4_MONRO|nr:guanine deaminase [Moniliophthora roreri MCA 2997]KAI3600030.1 guanine deaminase [Moniliophthora roreri]